MKVGIFGSEYQIERQNLIKRLFEKLREQEADIYVDSPFYTFLTDAFGFEPVVSGLLVGDEFDLDIALSVGGDGTFHLRRNRLGEYRTSGENRYGPY